MDLDTEETLAAHLLPRINNIALAFVRQYPAHLNKDDALSMSGLAIAIAIKQFDPKRGTIEHFADTIIRRRMISELRSAYTRKRYLDDSVHLSNGIDDDSDPAAANRGYTVPVSPETVEDVLITLENHAAIVKGLRRVGDADMALLRARHAGGTYAEVGRSVGITKQSAHERVTKAREAIRAEMESVG